MIIASEDVSLSWIQCHRRLVVLDVQERKSVLIFCGTIKRVQDTAHELAEMCEKGLFKVLERESGISSGNSPSKRSDFLSGLKNNTPVDLRACLQQGVGYHHSSAWSLCPCNSQCPGSHQLVIC